MHTLGHVDEAAVSGGRLRLRGWFLAPGHGPPSAIRVSIGDLAVEAADVRLGLPSDDVRQVFPATPGSDHARFEVAGAVDAAPEGLGDTLIRVETYFDGRLGKVLFHIVDPSFPIPPDELAKAVGGDFRQVGPEFLGHFVQCAGLRPSDAVLDVGCGVGRIAYGLAYYLAPSARYEGFDIVDSLVDWASANITPRYPNFSFRKVDVFNRHYNPSGTIRAEELRFPYADACFDFVCLTSVFTHMSRDAVRTYLGEIRRVLRPGGRSVATAFVLDDEAHRLVAEGRGHINLAHPALGGWTVSPEDPESAIGFDEDVLVHLVQDAGLVPRARHAGFWCGRPAGITFQDLWVLAPA